MNPKAGLRFSAAAMRAWPWRRGSPPWGLIALLVGVLGTLLRVLNAGPHLGQVHIDENDVVEQAVAFMGGEWRYHLLEYGALPMYILAGVYHLLALVQGVSGFEYAQRVFFDADQLYFVARLSSVAYLGLLALCSYRWLAPRYGASAGLVASGLLALPAVDGLTGGATRVDVLQGVCQMFALLGLLRALESRALRHWLWAGVAAGLGIACKPLPGLLVTPCFALASWYAAREESAASEPRPRLLRSGSQLLRALTRRELWAAALAALAAAVAANPTALDVSAFLKAQQEATGYYSGATAPGSHIDAFQAAAGLGLPFLAAACLSLAVIVWMPDFRARLLASFPLLYATAFWGRPVRTYYLVAPALALCCTIGIATGYLLGRSRLDPSTPGALGAAPRPPLARWLTFALLLVVVGTASYENAAYLDQRRRSTSDVVPARAWIHAHIPSGTSLFQYGTMSPAGGPILVSDDVEKEGELGYFFEFGRDHYDYLRRAYREAYARYAARGGPRYSIEGFRNRPTPKGSNKNPAWLATNLDRRAQRRNQQYILVAFPRDVESISQLGYDWFARVELVQQFGQIALFRVPPPG